MTMTTQTAAVQELASRRSPVARDAMTLIVAVLAFSVVTLDAVVVNVALPAIRDSLGGGVQGLQWIVDGYTLLFAAVLLSAGSLSDRIGARQSIGYGIAVFVLASLACGLAPSLGWLVVARVVQGAAAAVMMPASLALISQGYPDPVRRGRAIAMWAMGAAVASTSGPVIGGLLTLVDWRLIFLMNVPLGAVALLLLRGIAPSPHRPAPFDVVGQLTAVLAMGSLTYGAIETGAFGFGSPHVLVALALAVVAGLAFVVSQARGRHPMVPLQLFHSRTVSVVTVIGFAFMVGYYGLPFLFSLYFQQERGLTSLATGLTFLPMMLVGLVLTGYSARVIERFGSRIPIMCGLSLMAVGLLILGVLPPSAPVWLLSALMVLIGLGGPLVMPPVTGLLLSSVPAHQAGTASGVF
ncbi:MAG: MFS transporter, partial [Solirubrobacteraceae bacterium]